MKMKKIISMISAAVIAASMSAVAAVPASAASDTGWKTAYTKYLKQEAKKSDAYVNRDFSVYDLDGNGTPELILLPDTVYTYKGGKMVKVKIESDDEYTPLGLGGLEYSPAKHTFAIQPGGSSRYIVELNQIFKMENDRIFMCFSADVFVDDNSNYEYLINKKKCSESEYEKAYAENIPSETISIGYSFKMTESDIDCALSGGKNYKKLYKKFLKGRISENITGNFRYVDITGDKVPEIFISNKFGSMCVYTYKNNVLTYIGTVDYSKQNGESIGWDKANNCICTHRADSSGERYNFYSVTKDGVLSGKRFYKYSEQGGSSAKYYINDVEVSLDKYNSELNKYTKMKFKSVGKDYTLTANNIKKVIK